MHPMSLETRSQSIFSLSTMALLLVGLRSKPCSAADWSTVVCSFSISSLVHRSLGLYIQAQHTRDLWLDNKPALCALVPELHLCWNTRDRCTDTCVIPVKVHQPVNPALSGAPEDA